MFCTDFYRTVKAAIIMVPVGVYLIVVAVLFYCLVPAPSEDGGGSSHGDF